MLLQLLFFFPPGYTDHSKKQQSLYMNLFRGVIEIGDEKLSNVCLISTTSSGIV